MCTCVCRFLCGTVNEFVAEVGKAYEKATENKEEADAMAKKVCVQYVFMYVCVCVWEVDLKWMCVGAG